MDNLCKKLGSLQTVIAHSPALKSRCLFNQKILLDVLPLFLNILNTGGSRLLRFDKFSKIRIGYAGKETLHDQKIKFLKIMDDLLDLISESYNNGKENFILTV
jgi:hypothetical protein